jgi:protein-tyrosine phosphatase
MARGIETAEEAHFLVRVGTWGPAELADWCQRWWDNEFVECDDEEYEYDEEVGGGI